MRTGDGAVEWLGPGVQSRTPQSVRPMGKTMRIGMFLHDLNDRGVSRVVRQISRALIDEGVDVSIVCITKDDDLPFLDGLPVVELGSPDTGKLDAVGKFAEAMSRHAFDVVFAHGEGPSRDAVLARMLSDRKPGLVIVSHIHRTTHPMRARRIKDLLARFLYPKADIIAGVSPGVVEDLVELCSGVDDRVAILPNPSPLVPESRLRSTPDHPWFLDDDVQVVISIGHMNRRKGHDDVLRAFDEIRKGHPEARLMILGAADDQGYVAELYDYVEERGLDSSVAFIHDVNDVLPYLAASDIFVHAAHSEAFGLVIMEALTVGVPAVVVDSPGGAGWLLDGGRFGKLVPLGDNAALGAGIAELLQSRLDRQRLSRLGRERAAEFSEESVAAMYLDTARSLTGVSPSR